MSSDIMIKKINKHNELDVRSALSWLSFSMKNFVIGLEGNVSGKLNSKEYLIKASGRKLPNMSITKDLVKMDFNGKQLDNFENKPSMEYEFHSFLLGFDDINYVAHTHPINTLKILCGEHVKLFAQDRYFPDQVIFNNKVSCIVEYFTPGKKLYNGIKESVYKFIKENGFFPKLILLKNHGIITCGKTIEECSITTEICEKSAEVFLHLLYTGVGFSLTKKSINELLNDESEKYRISKLNT